MKHCRKVRHKSQTAAVKAKIAVNNSILQTYYCKECHAWHLGSSNHPARRANRIGEILARHTEQLDKRMAHIKAERDND